MISWLILFYKFRQNHDGQKKNRKEKFHVVHLLSDHEAPKFGLLGILLGEVGVIGLKRF